MLLNILKKQFPTEKIVLKGRDLYFYSKNRIESKKKTEIFFEKNKIDYVSVFKKSKSSSLDVLTVGKEDIVFKPIIAKGAGGIKFEKEVEIDLKNFFAGAEYSELNHPDVIQELEKVIKIKPGNWSVKAEGFKNQKRPLIFNGQDRITITNSSGATLTDLTLLKNSTPVYLSLKKSPTYYTLSASIFKYFLDPRTKKQINEFFGFNGLKMSGFGNEYSVSTKEPNYNTVSNNLSDVLSQAIGNNVVLVHKKQNNDVLVTDVGMNSNVSISGLSGASYSYPETGIRKYANIKVNARINNHNYVVNFQFRGTTAVDVGPKYLRILLERL